MSTRFPRVVLAVPWIVAFSAPDSRAGSEYRYSGRDFRLTDVHGTVLHDILS